MKRLNIRRIVQCLLYMASIFLLQRCTAQTGTVLGFGYNTFGQIGDGTIRDRPLPTPALHISGIKSVSSGTYHTLALDAGGRVWAWGINSYGQLGTGDYTSHSEPVLVLSGIKAIAAGGYFSLALDFQGKVWAWGDNYQGQLGMGDFVPHLRPMQMTDSNNIVIKSIAAGGFHSLLVNEYGALFGCGQNSEGQLAQPDFKDHPSLIFMSFGAIQAAAGGRHTLLLTSAHQVWATGYNADGELGDETNSNSHSWVYTGGAVRSIAAGNSHSLAVGLNGRAYGCGANESGQLGLGFAGGNFNEMTEIPAAVNVKEVAAGGFHTLVLTADGKVLATGQNAQGQLGDGTTTSHSRLTPVHNADFITSIAAGFQHSVVFRPYTQALATGGNTVGQLGDGTNSQKNRPVPIAGVSHITAAAAGNASGYFSLLLRADGTAWACGSNQFGQLGNGTTTLKPNPTPMPVRGPKGVGYLSNIIAIAAGNSHSLALAADGTVYSWGLNNLGQLGVGNRISSVFPVHVPNVQNIFAIAAGAAHSLLLGLEGQLYGAGWNQFGQLGLPNQTNHLAFEPCIGFNHQIAVAAGSGHSLSLEYTGVIYGWGDNANGQLALGDTRGRGFPAPQPGTAAIAIACGGFHSLHLNAEGEVFVSGMNRYGQLGLGDAGQRLFWSYNDLKEMSEIAAGNSHSLIINPYGTLLAAGYDAAGQLGNGTTTTSFTFGPGSEVTNMIGMACGQLHTLLLTTPYVRLASISIIPASVKGGTSANGTVTLDSVAGPGGQRVYLSVYSMNQRGQYVDAATVPAYIDVSAASRTATFPITTRKVNTKTNATINGWLNKTLSSMLTILP